MMSSVPKNKEELLKAITDIYEKLRKDYANIPPELTRKNEIEGNVKGTQVNVCDTLAYLVGWENLVLKWYNKKAKNKPVDFPETGFKWNELGRLAQYFQKQHIEHSYEELLKEFDAVTYRIIDLISGLDNYSLYGTSWYEKWTLGRMIQFNTSSPMKNMRTKVRRFKRENGIK